MPTIPTMPKLPPGFLGPQAKFKNFKLDVFSHTNSIIRLFSGNQVSIRIGYTYPTLMDFELQNADTGRDGSKYVYKEIDEDEQVVKFNITLPRKGSWKFMIYAQPVHDEAGGSGLENVFNYLLLCARISKKAKPHPRQSKEWREGFVLRSPMDIGPEKAGTEVSFSLGIPNASGVSVVIGQEWTELERMSPQSKEWSGKVFLHKSYFGYGEKVSVNVRFQEDCPSYATVLEYTI